MSETPAPVTAGWTHGTLPANVRLGANTLITADYAFKRFRTKQPDALILGSHCTMDGVHFAIGEAGRVLIGDYCYFTNAVLLCELELRIGNYVVIGWNTTIADTDFHPLAHAERIADAIACSPWRMDAGIAKRPVIIEDDVWIAERDDPRGAHRLRRLIEAGSRRRMRLAAVCWATRPNRSDPK
jgi:hypothetical protein